MKFTAIAPALFRPASRNTGTGTGPRRRRRKGGNRRRRHSTST